MILGSISKQVFLTYLPSRSNMQNHKRYSAKNRKTKKRQRRNKGKLKSILDLAEKDHLIEKLQKDLRTSKKSMNIQTIMKPPRQIFTSCVNIQHSSKATPSKVGKNVEGSRDTIIKSLPGIPSFTDAGVTILQDKIGEGQFGSIHLASLQKLGITIAAKVPKVKSSSNKAILAEVVVGMTLSGHSNFPYCFGVLNESVILMELFCSEDKTACPSFAKKLKIGMTLVELKESCAGVLEAIKFMHSKRLLHNDIKADNIIISNVIKVIDFGKTTMLSNPLSYNISPGSKEHEAYNRNHRHLAHELRNIPGSKQTTKTDIYSIGYMFKHSAASMNYLPIIELGRKMKRTDPTERLSLENAMDKLKLF